MQNVIRYGVLVLLIVIIIYFIQHPSKLNWIASSIGVLLYCWLDYSLRDYTDQLNTRDYTDQLNTLENRQAVFLGGASANKPQALALSLEERTYTNDAHVNMEEVAEYMKTGKLCASHFPKNSKPKEAPRYYRTITDGFPEIKYEYRPNEYVKSLHFGQLKLLLSEIEFLMIAMQDHVAIKSTKPIVCLYIGAAPGNHTKYLSDLFPEVKFVLYDPRPFVVKPSSRIEIHQQLYLEEDAAEWKKKSDQYYLAFVSDIRVNGTEEQIVLDMELQKNQWITLNPDISMFKFRLPWGEGETEYMKGDIYLQIYPRINSTETRLIVKKDAPMIIYDNLKYERQCAAHNAARKTQCFASHLPEMHTDTGINPIDCCYDCVSYAVIVRDYLQFRGKPAEEADIKKMMHEIEAAIYKESIKFKTIQHLKKQIDKYKSKR
jgi:hypothetical protein